MYPFEGAAGSEHGFVIEPVTDELHPDRESGVREPRRNRDLRMIGEVVRVHETPPDERIDVLTVDRGRSNRLPCFPYEDRWLQYFYRRIRERKENLWFALRAILGR